MATIKEPIIANPKPNAWLTIVAILGAAYTQFAKQVAEWLNNAVARYGATGRVVTSYVVGNKFATPSVSSPAGEVWFFDTAVPANKNLLFVPALADLGITDANNLKVEVQGRLTVTDNGLTNDPLELALLDEDENVVPGSLTTVVMSGGSKEFVVALPWVEVPTNTGYYIDFRKLDVSGPTEAQARFSSLIVRVVRR